MEQRYLNKAKYSFLSLMLAGFIVMPFSFGVGVFIAVLGLIFFIRFLNWSAKETIYLTNDDRRVIPKLKELYKVEVLKDTGRKKTLSEQELKKLKALFKRVKVISSTSSMKRKFQVTITDTYDGVWELELAITEEDGLEFVSDRTHFGGSSMKEVGELLGVNA